MRDNSMQQEKHATYWKEEWRKIQYGRVAELRREQAGGPHCPLDIRSLRLRGGTAAWWNTSTEQLLWWPCARQIGGRQCRIIIKNLHIYIYMHHHCYYISFHCVSGFRARKCLIFLSVYFDIRIDLFLNTVLQLSSACFHHRLHN